MTGRRRQLRKCGARAPGLAIVHNLVALARRLRRTAYSRHRSRQPSFTSSFPGRARERRVRRADTTRSGRRCLPPDARKVWVVDDNREAAISCGLTFRSLPRGPGRPSMAPSALVSWAALPDVALLDNRLSRDGRY